jgi:hypothetical protein
VCCLIIFCLIGLCTIDIMRPFVTHMHLLVSLILVLKFFEYNVLNLIARRVNLIASMLQV